MPQALSRATPSSSAPSSWAKAYVGLPYVLGSGECGHRAALVWREVFGIEVEAAPARGDLALAQRHIQAALAGPEWVQVRLPAEGDAVIMWKGHLAAHVGVWVAPGHVLHCTRRDGMVLSAMDDLAGEGFRVMGCFRHRAEMAMAA